MAAIEKLSRTDGPVYKAVIRKRGQGQSKISILSACVKRWHWLAASPMVQAQKLTERNGGLRFLSDDEAAWLLKACRESESPDLYLAVPLSLTTGARQGEILGLRWQDLDLAAGSMVVRAGAETTTKGGARSLAFVP